MADMSGLAALMAKRKAGVVEPTPAPPPAAPVIQATQTVEPPKETKNVTVAIKGKNPLAGFGRKVVAATAVQPDESAAKQVHRDAAGVQLESGRAAENEVGGIGSLDSLADLEAITDAGIAPNSAKREESEYLRSRMSEFTDETPATKPVRELPAEIESQQRQFVEMMDGVYDLLDDPELLGDVIKNIMIELKANPQYIQMVTKDDVRQWVRTMRNTMGLARIKKLETKGSRGTSKARPKTKTLDEDVLNAAAGIDWDNV